MGMYLSGHPLDPYWVDVKYAVDMSAAEKNDITEPTSQFTFAGIVTSVENRTLNSGSTMMNVKIEDFSGTTEFTLFERGIQEYGHLCTVGQPLLVRGFFNFDISVREVYVSAGAGFVVVLTGAVMTMPGLPKKPAAYSIDVSEDGMITGLF